MDDTLLITSFIDKQCETFLRLAVAVLISEEKMEPARRLCDIYGFER